MGRKATVHLNLPRGMRARVRHRKNGKTVVYYYYDAGGCPRKEISLGTDYVTAVQEWSKLEVAKIPKGAMITFTTAAHAYMTEVVVHKADNTIRSAKYAVKHLTQFFGNPDAPLDEIEPKHIAQYLDWRKDAASSANIEVAYFSSIFNYARSKGYTNRQNPCQGVKRHPKKSRDVYVEDYVYQAVYEQADQQMRDLMDIAYLIGQRPVDIVKLHTDHIHEGILHITQKKTKAKLRFAITGRLKDILDRIMPERGYLFVSNRGTHISAQALAKRFLGLRNKTIAAHPEMEHELRDFQFRDLRAKSGTDMYLQANTEAAREQLGHTSSQMTKVYIRKGKILKPLK